MEICSREKERELAGVTNKGKKKGELADVTINIEYENSGSSKRKQIRYMHIDRAKKRNRSETSQIIRHTNQWNINGRRWDER